MTNKEFYFTDIGKTMPYRTPDNFFERMPDLIMTKIKPHQQKSHPLRLMMATILTTAAVLAVLFFISFHHSTQNTSTRQTAKLTTGTYSVTNQKEMKEIDSETMARVIVPKRSHLKATTVKTTNSDAYVNTRNDDEWIENLSDNDLSTLTALAENDEFLN